jgi:hypothetical protein
MINKKDLVMRGDVLARKRKYRVYDETGCYCMEFAVSVKDINRISPVPREMTAKELLHIELRMFGKYLEAWSEYSDYVINGKVEEAVQFAETWARKHPEERSKEDA